MVSQMNEQALEIAIEQTLVGISREEIAQGATIEPLPHHYQASFSTDFDPHYALDKRLFWAFLQATQANELAKLQKYNPNDWQLKILERFDRIIKKQGILQLLKKGLDIDDAHFDLMYPLPLASSSEQIKDNFSQNIFSCARQLHYSAANPNQSIDMVLFINGIPLITLELKNPWTGQTARYHGQKQYKEDRDINQPLLQFARCLVHMAVDTDEVYMTTKLAGKDTDFLPFNKGNNLGKGNPPNLNGHRTAYLWQEVFTKQSLANIIQHFVRLGGDPKKSLSKHTLFFPRYHQLDVVRRLVNDASQQGVGKTYLIQHSAGSGKSNSITWAAYQLIETYPCSMAVKGAKALDEPLFDSVIVVTDRRQLDKQLKDNIKDFSEVKNIISHAKKSSDLKTALENGKKIIITTIQKFPVIVKDIADLSGKRFAVIIDEAHSSQSGQAHDKMNQVMGKDLDEIDAQDKILEAMRNRKIRENASYFAFTATPKNTTLEKFGEQHADGTFHPFHLYSMKQAIEEGFILDVLANYTTYRSYYEIQKSIEDNPQFDTNKAQKKLRAFVERNPQTIAVKAEIMLNHFISKVVNTKKLKGEAKGIVATQSIESAIHYYQAITNLLKQRGNPFKAIIAFSGSKKVNGVDYTEADINGFSDTKTDEKFDTDEYRLLIVANKYLTGFDQPKLTAMYVDKKLRYVQAVQALSRLNRAAPKLGKRTEDLFILDFFNDVDDIKKAFDPFYTSTSLSGATDVNVLHELKSSLDDTGIYEWHEVEQFTVGYFNNEDSQLLGSIIDKAADRFNKDLDLSHETKVDIKVKAKQFVKIYGQMASILPYEVLVWEKLFWFLKFLIPKLNVKDKEIDELGELLESVDLNSYGLQRVKLNYQINLDSSNTEVDPQNPNPRTVDSETEIEPLDEIIEHFNERWFQGWNSTPDEQKVKFINIAQNIGAHPDYKAKFETNPDPYTRSLAFEKILKEVMLKHRKDALKSNREDLEMYKLYANDDAFRFAFIQSLQNILKNDFYKDLSD